MSVGPFSLSLTHNRWQNNMYKSSLKSNIISSRLHWCIQSRVGWEQAPWILCSCLNIWWNCVSSRGAPIPAGTSMFSIIMETFFCTHIKCKVNTMKFGNGALLPKRGQGIHSKVNYCYLGTYTGPQGSTLKVEFSDTVLKAYWNTKGHEPACKFLYINWM